jgi:hypothetical protein
MADTPHESLLDRLKKLLKPTAPVTPATPVIPEPSRLQYLKAWAILRQIDFKKLGPAVFTVPAVLFFAISGFIAWLGLLVGFFIRIVKAVVWPRHD